MSNGEADSCFPHIQNSECIHHKMIYEESKMKSQPFDDFGGSVRWSRTGTEGLMLLGQVTIMIKGELFL